MTQPRPMSTPIFDELLREFASRLEEQRGVPPDQPESQAHPAQQAQPGQPVHRHRAE